MQVFRIFSVALLTSVGYCLPPSGMHDIGEETTPSRPSSDTTINMLTVMQKMEEFEEKKGKMDKLKEKVRKIYEFEEKMKKLKHDREIQIKNLWPKMFENTVAQIGEVVGKLLDPKNTGPKPRGTVPVPKVILTTAKGTDQNYNLMRWFQDLRHYFAHTHCKPDSTTYDYVLELLNKLLEAVNLAEECKDQLLYQFIPKDKLDELIKKIEDFRFIYQANRQQEIPPRNVKKLNEVLIKIVSIICNADYKF